MKRLILCTLLLCAIGFYACENDDNKGIKEIQVTLRLSNPKNLEEVTLTNLEVTLTERNSGNIYSAHAVVGNTVTTVIPEGAYNLIVKGSITYTLDQNMMESEIRAMKESVLITGDAVEINMDPFLYSETSGFVIQEIFYTGSATPEGKQYNGDKYIRIYNNSDTILYADGLFIATTMLNSSISYVYDPDILETDVPVSSIVIIPGDGTRFPVEPGKSLLIADNAINHKENSEIDGETVPGNANSFDLSKADLEWCNTELLGEVDNPAVPNVENLYSNFMLHNSGLTSVIMGRLKTDRETYLKDYIYTYTWTWVFNGNTYKRGPFEEYRIPNKWVIDAVYTSVSDKAVRPVFSASLDLGWSYCGEFFGDATRYNKSIRRKVLSTTPDGRDILKDTNNSAVDFEANATPFLK